MKKKNNKILITAALPYSNYYIHLGHIYSTFLFSDIKVRCLKLQGKSVDFISGSDIFGFKNFISSKKENILPIQRSIFYHKQNKKLLKYFQIDIKFFHTNIKIHKKNVEKIFNYLLKINKIHSFEKKLIYCEECKIFLGINFINNNKCSFCKKTWKYIKKIIYSFKHLPKNMLLELFKKNYYNNRAEKIKNNILYSKEIDINRYNSFYLKINNKKSNNDLYIWVWWEALISYISFTKKIKSNWNNYKYIYQFFGKDNFRFHFVTFNSILNYLNKKKIDKIFVGNFLNLEKKKFSKSEKRGIFLNDIYKKKHDSDIYRFLLFFIYKKDKDIEITKNLFQSNIKLFFNRFINSINRIFGILKKKFFYFNNILFLRINNYNSIYYFKYKKLFKNFINYISSNKISDARDFLLQILNSLIIKIEECLKKNNYKIILDMLTTISYFIIITPNIFKTIKKKFFFKINYYNFFKYIYNLRNKKEIFFIIKKPKIFFNLKKYLNIL